MSAWLWLGAGGLFLALGRPTRHFLHAMPKSESKEPSLKCAQESQQISVYSYTTHLRFFALARIPPNSTGVEED